VARLARCAAALKTELALADAFLRVESLPAAAGSGQAVE
jgi:hypothetical protein